MIYPRETPIAILKKCKSGKISMSARRNPRSLLHFLHQFEVNRRRGPLSLQPLETQRLAIKEKMSPRSLLHQSADVGVAGRRDASGARNYPRPLSKTHAPRPGIRSSQRITAISCSRPSLQGYSSVGRRESLVIVLEETLDQPKDEISSSRTKSSPSFSSLRFKISRDLDDEGSPNALSL